MIKYFVLIIIAAAIALMGTFTAMRSEKGKSADRVTNDTTIRDVLALDEGMADMLARHGMYCSGCPSAVSETVEEACTVHNLDTDEILSAINNYIKEKNNDN